MIGTLFTNPLLFFGWFVALIVAITVHEFAHAFAADRLGDPTPRIQGRLTLNPLAHLDPLGTLMILFVRFGWGKPVQFDPFNLNNPKRDAAIISFAGPVSNIILAITASIILRVLGSLSPVAFVLLSVFLQPIILLNIILAVFNLIPVHPLDGFKIVGGFLNREQYAQWMQLQSYGIFILILLLLPIGPGGAFIQRLIGPPIEFLVNVLIPSSVQLI